MPFAELGTDVPSRGGRRVRHVCRTMLRAARWDMEGQFPNLSKFVLIGAPHTSNWDFLVAMLLMGGLGIRAHWFVKHTVYRGPIAPVLRSLGGIPVDRSTHHGVVEQAIQLFRSRDKLILGITPEGTRKRVAKWKTGFWHIATGASVPIVPAYFDYPRRRVGLGNLFWPGSDVESDIEELRTFYAPYARAGRRPELY